MIIATTYAFSQDALEIKSDGRIYINNNGKEIDLIEYLTPVGAVVPFIGTVAHDGWVMCDGTDLTIDPKYDGLQTLLVSSGMDDTKTLDLRGLFIRGAGSNGSMTKANCNAFNGGTVGDENNDKLQGHRHG